MGRLNPTLEHLYPQNSVFPSQLRDWSDPANKFRACFNCNNLKGDLHPLKWLTIMENDDCAVSISKCMLALGENPYQVGFAMGIRTGVKHHGIVAASLEDGTKRISKRSVIARH